MLLILAAVVLLVFEFRSGNLSSLRLPEFLRLGRDRPEATPAPVFEPSPEVWPRATPPQISVPSLPSPSGFLPQIGAPAGSSPVPAPPSMQEAYPSVFFGRYEQKGRQDAIEWFVLERREDRCLLLSRFALDQRPFHGTKDAITWGRCDLRRWLNGDFLDSAFTEEEWEASLLTRVDNSLGNPVFETEGGKNTEDRVFLLSREEVEDYFPTAGERLCKPTANTSGFSLMGYNSWWLRTPGYKQTVWEYVDSNGAFSGGDVDRSFTAVRPAMWVSADLLPEG